MVTKFLSKTKGYCNPMTLKYLKKTVDQYFFRLLIIPFLFIFFYLTCGKTTDSNQVVVARVGNRNITVEDFRYNYEFGLPHLKQGPDRKRSYLDFMIKEQILSLDGYRLGLDKTKRVQMLEKELLDELLVEELFRKEVNEKIKISPEEIKEAITKSKVKWKLRYWSEPNLEYANSVCQAMRHRGYSAVISDILNSNPEVNLKLDEFETDYLTWLDVSPELLSAIKDLPIGEISDPVEMNGVYHIFQIADIRREPLTDYEFQSKAGTYKKIIYYRKLQKKAAKFVSSYMTPKNVVTKGDAFRKLSDAVMEWDKNREENHNNFSDAIKETKDKDSALFKLKNSLHQTLVTFEKTKWTIKDFIGRFNFNSIKAESKEKNSFRSVLNQQIALTVRNHFFINDARKNDLHKSPTVKKQLQDWRDKWVYEEVRRFYTKNLKISDEQAKAYFKKYKDKYKIRWDDNLIYANFANQSKRDVYIQTARAILNQKIDSLKNVYSVTINHAVLDTITVIDFKKSRWASFQILKKSSNRIARPFIDPAWGW